MHVEERRSFAQYAAKCALQGDESLLNEITRMRRLSELGIPNIQKVVDSFNFSVEDQDRRGSTKIEFTCLVTSLLYKDLNAYSSSTDHPPFSDYQLLYIAYQGIQTLMSNGSQY